MLPAYDLPCAETEFGIRGLRRCPACNKLATHVLGYQCTAASTDPDKKEKSELPFLVHVRRTLLPGQSIARTRRVRVDVDVSLGYSWVYLF